MLALKNVAGAEGKFEHKTNTFTYILQLLERRGNSIHTRHILIRPEMTQADLDLAENLLDSVRQLVVDDSLSFSRAIKKYGYDE
mgnify:CR=1 FL=1